MVLPIFGLTADLEKHREIHARPASLLLMARHQHLQRQSQLLPPEQRLIGAKPAEHLG